MNIERLPAAYCHETDKTYGQSSIRNDDGRDNMNATENNINDVIGQVKKTNRAACAARVLAHLFAVFCQITTNFENSRNI